MSMTNILIRILKNNKQKAVLNMLNRIQNIIIQMETTNKLFCIFHINATDLIFMVIWSYSAEFTEAH
jgi:hypothetical protein